MVNFRFFGVVLSEDKLQLDHMIPTSRGGTSSKNNLQTLCSKCNCGKRDIIMDLNINKTEDALV